MNEFAPEAAATIGRMTEAGWHVYFRWTGKERDWQFVKHVPASGGGHLCRTGSDPDIAKAAKKALANERRGH